MDNNKKTSSDFLKQGSILAAASLIVRFIGMIYRIPMSNILGEEGNGIYAVAFDIYDIVLIVSSYSLPLALSKIISMQNIKREYKNIGKTFKLAMIFGVVSGGLFGLLLFILSGWIEENIYPDYAGVRIPLRILAPTIFIVAVLGVFRGFFQGKKTMIPTAVSQVLEQIVNAVVSIWAAYSFIKWNADSFEKSAWGAAGGTLGTCMGALFALFLVAFVYIVYHPVQKKLESKDRRRRLYSAKHIYGILFLTILPVILSQTVYQISGLIDYYIFGNVLGNKGYTTVAIKSLTGIYSSKYRLLTSVPIAISTSVASSMIPSAVAAYTQHDFKTLGDNIKSGIKFNMLIAFPCAIGYTVLGQAIVRLLFPSSDYVLGGHLMLAGSTAVIFYAISNVTGGALQSIDRMALPVIHSAISLVLHVGVVFVCLSYTDIGVYSLIIGNITFPIVVSIFNLIAIKRNVRHINLELIKTLSKPFMASVIMAVIVWPCYTLLDMLLEKAVSGYIANAISLMFALLIAVVTYFVAFFLLKGMTKEEVYNLPCGVRIYKIAKRFKLIE
ncbi:putative polysaccharide biosynthesis protein [Eubacterium xylanophilum]|uniref:putative polysaccharide biosynthesis protein n=1 Tax=Eubacterium xylanophilum TaxID=39497 RepID=UPI00047D8C98|nr:polysaccharide biosynthesis protein [Eubacterium xylanophilum]